MSRRKIANAAARRIIARLRSVPEDGKLMVHGDYGFRVLPAEWYIEAFGQWAKCDGSTISGGPQGYLYPGPVMRWRMRRLYRWWADQVELPPICDHRSQGSTFWSHDGYVSLCNICKQTVYHGEGG